MTGIKNWAKFQHFKDRKPPWVKLYRDLLDDKEWHKLDPKAAKTLVSLWLIASESDGYLPDIETLSFRLRTGEQEIKEALLALSHWLIYDDICLISSRHRDDAPETETETETEIKPSASPNGLICPQKEIISLYHQILPSMPTVREWTRARESKLKARWKESTERQSLDWWRGFFTYVSQSDFLCGKTDKPFVCNLEWLVTPGNFAKVIEGNYENRTKQ